MIQVPDDEGACKYYDETYEKIFEDVDDDGDFDGDFDHEHDHDDGDDNDGANTLAVKGQLFGCGGQGLSKSPTSVQTETHILRYNMYKWMTCFMYQNF